MRARLHPAVHLDLFEVMDYYVSVAGTTLAGEFYEEFRRCVVKIEARPASFVPIGNELRRCNFKRFPHHILFEVKDDLEITIFVVKHDHRDPRFGIERLRDLD